MKKCFSIGLLAVAVSLSGCLQKTTQTTLPTPIALPVATVSPFPTSIDAEPQQDHFGDAVEKADRATQLSRGAVSNDDWALVAHSWQQSVDLLKQVPKASASYTQAQTKLKQYNTVLASAKAKAGRATSLPPVRPPASVQASVAQPVAQKSQTPAPVTVQDFMENHYFAETVGRGGSGQGYWCQKYLILESSLFAPRSYEVLDVSGGSVTARIESSNRGGQPIIANWSFTVLKGQTVSEYEYKKANSPVTAEAFRKHVGGWCLASVFEK